LVFFIAFDVRVLGRVYALEYNDAAAGGYGAGLDWLTLHAWPTPYHPAYLFHQSTAILVALAGIYPADLNGFQAGVLVVNALVHFLSGLWAAGAARRIDLGMVDAATLGILVVAMPSVLVYASQWAPYVMLASLITAFTIVVFELFVADRNPRARWWSAGIGIGLIAGLYFPAVSIAVALIAAVFGRVALSSPRQADQWLGFGDGPPSVRLAIVTYLVICATGAAQGTLQTCFHLFPNWRIYDYDWDALAISFLVAMLVSVAPTIAILWSERHLGRWGRVIPGAAAPTLIGWLIAANVMAPFWRYAAEGALRSRSGVITMDRAHLVFFRFFEHFWNVLIVLALVVLLIAAMRAVVQKNRAIALLSFSGIAVCLLNLGAAMRTLVETPAVAVDAGRFGQGPRVFICALLTVTMAYLVMRTYPARLVRRATLAVVLFFAAASFWQDAAILGPATQRVKETVDKINATTTLHLRTNESPRVLCVNSRIPEECAMAYAFDHSRYPRARAILPPPQIKDGAVCLVRGNVSGDCQKAEEIWHRAACGPRNGPMLISEERAESDPYPKNTVFDGYFFGLRIDVSACPVGSVER
jgi:hypothetical protein